MHHFRKGGENLVIGTIAAVQIGKVVQLFQSRAARLGQECRRLSIGSEILLRPASANLRIEYEQTFPGLY